MPSLPPVTRRRIAWLFALVALLVSARAEPSELAVGAAASLRPALPRIVALYQAQHAGSRVRVAYGASSVLAAQIRAGAPLDVLLSADERIVADLAAEGQVGSQLPFAGNRLVVLVSRDLDVRVAAPADLAAAGLRRIAIPSPAVPEGRYAREWLATRGLSAALEGRAVRTEHALATLAAVDHGDADAAIVYASDARRARSARVAFEIPESEQPRIVYAAAVVTGARDAEGARAFLSLLRSPEALRALLDAGFARPPDTRAQTP